MKTFFYFGDLKIQILGSNLFFLFGRAPISNKDFSSNESGFGFLSEHKLCID